MDSTGQPKLELVYTLFCDDVRLEVGNKLSYMGVFQSIVVPQLPVWLPKLAVVNHWRGEGAHLSEVRILMPDVFDREPPATDNPLLTLDNVVTAPHMAGVTRESVDRMAGQAVRNVLSVFDGKPIRENVINPEVLA